MNGLVRFDLKTDLKDSKIEDEDLKDMIVGGDRDRIQTNTNERIGNLEK